MSRQPKKNRLAVLLATGQGTAEERAEAARKLGRRAWNSRTAKEQQEILKRLAAISNGRPRDKTQARCPCGRMTLKRAIARGICQQGHLVGCRFHA